jgi:hypothetical protein
MSLCGRGFATSRISIVGYLLSLIVVDCCGLSHSISVSSIRACENGQQIITSALFIFGFDSLEQK